MSHTHKRTKKKPISNTLERIKKRRAYLWTKEKAYSNMIKGGLAFAFGVFASLVCLYGIYGSYWDELHDPPITEDCQQQMIDFTACMLVFGLLAWSGWMTAKEGKQALKVPYVPPVTADTLPAEEILVRGSQEPTQEQSRVLLRGTYSRTGTGEQELLRGSQEHEQECWSLTLMPSVAGPADPHRFLRTQ